MRIETHPILENFEKGRLVHFTFDGKDMIGYEGEPIAEALRAGRKREGQYENVYHTTRGKYGG